jgi:hypothetical protein
MKLPDLQQTNDALGARQPSLDQGQDRVDDEGCEEQEPECLASEPECLTDGPEEQSSLV